MPAPDGENPFGEGQEASTDGKSKSELAADKKAWLQDPSRDYTYQEVSLSRPVRAQHAKVAVQLLGRFYTLLFAGNPSLSREGGKKRYTIVPPNVQREGSKRTSFANIAEICKKLRRQPEHVIQFMFAELGTSGSVDGSGRLIIKGRFQQKQIENVLRRYIVEYVNCKTCKLPDTLLTKVRASSLQSRLLLTLCAGQPSVLRDVRNVRIEAVSGEHQGWFPGADEEAAEGGIVHCSSCYVVVSRQHCSIRRDVRIAE